MDEEIVSYENKKVIADKTGREFLVRLSAQVTDPKTGGKLIFRLPNLDEISYEGRQKYMEFLKAFDAAETAFAEFIVNEPVGRLISITTAKESGLK